MTAPHAHDHTNRPTKSAEYCKMRCCTQMTETSVTVYLRLTSPGGGGGGTGDLVIAGSQGDKDSSAFASNFLRNSKGGNSFMGAGGEAIASNTTFVNNGKNYGGGATGRANSVSQSAGAGGTGGPGIVIVELFA